MLRLTSSITAETTCLIVEGKLAGACVGELEKFWRATAGEGSSRLIVIDLSSVTFVDAHGKQLLAQMYDQGIQLKASGLLARCLVAEIENSAAGHCS